MSRFPVLPDERPLHWIGSSKRDYLDFPDTVIKQMGYALGAAQYGKKHPTAKPWKGEEPGVFEIVEDHMGNAYRAVYTVRFQHAVYVLHAFQKKSRKRIKTPKSDVDLISARLKWAAADYKQHYETGERQ